MVKILYDVIVLEPSISFYIMYDYITVNCNIMLTVVATTYLKDK